MSKEPWSSDEPSEFTLPPAAQCSLKRKSKGYPSLPIARGLKGYFGPESNSRTVDDTCPRDEEAKNRTENAASYDQKAIRVIEDYTKFKEGTPYITYKEYIVSRQTEQPQKFIRESYVNELTANHGVKGELEYKATMRPDGKAGTVEFFTKPSSAGQTYDYFRIELKPDGTRSAEVMTKKSVALDDAEPKKDEVIGTKSIDYGLAVAVMRNHVERIFDPVDGRNTNPNKDMRKLLGKKPVSFVFPDFIQETLQKAGAAAANPTADIAHGLAVNYNAGALSIGRPVP